jgi:hypothetical protein
MFDNIISCYPNDHPVQPLAEELKIVFHQKSEKIINITL